MNQLVFIDNSQPVTDSLTIAEMFGKRHDHVLRDIKNQIDLAGENFAVPNFGESTYQDKNQQLRPKFNLTEEAFTLVVFSYNTREAVQTKIKFIQEFKRMSEQLNKPNNTKLLLQTALEHEEKIEIHDKRISLLEESMRIDGIQERKIQNKGNQIVIEFLGGKNSPAYKKISRKAFSELWRDFKNHFMIPRFSELPKKQFEEGLRFIGMWQPSTSLRIDIENTNQQQTMKGVI